MRSYTIDTIQKCQLHNSTGVVSSLSHAGIERAAIVLLLSLELLTSCCDGTIGSCGQNRGSNCLLCPMLAKPLHIHTYTQSHLEFCRMGQQSYCRLSDSESSCIQAGAGTGRQRQGQRETGLARMGHQSSVS